jgi:hypothetical protein
VGVSHYGLATYIKKVSLRQKRSILWKLQIFHHHATNIYHLQKENPLKKKKPKSFKILL